MKRKNNPLRNIYAFLFIAFIAFIPFAQADVMEDRPVVKIQALDKSTARTVTFQAKVGSTIQYGSLFIKTQACREAPPLDKPESAAFLQVWEVPIGKEKSEWIFSGWMFASSPALSAMDHPVYDVWVLGCLGGEENVEAKESKTKKQTADPAALEPVEGAPEEESTDEASEETVLEDEPMQGTLETGEPSTDQSSDDLNFLLDSVTQESEDSIAE